MKVFKNNQNGQIMVVKEITRAFDPASVGMDASLVCEIQSMDELPSKYFQSCWKATAEGDAVEIDMDAARAQKMDEIRARRDEELVKTDAKYLEILSKAQDTTAIMALKNTLRDLPANVDLSAMDAAELESHDAFASVDFSAMA